MSTDTKYNLTNPSPVQVIAGEILMLEDRSRVNISTDCFEDFVAICEHSRSLGTDLSLVAGCSSVQAWDASAKPSRYLRPIAQLNLSRHPRLSELVNKNGRDMGTKDAETFLRHVRENLDNNGLAVLLRMRDLKIEKTLKIEQKREPNGNHSYAMQLESGVNDWIPPAVVTFTVPTFNFIDGQIAIPFDLSLTIKDIGEGKDQTQTLALRFDCLDIEEHLLNGQRLVILQAFRERGFEEIMWAKIQVEEDDNIWQIVHNQVEGISRLKK
jgi:hypothetical protein